MKLKLNGWHRLWIVAVVIWGVITATVAYLWRAQPQTTSHQESFLSAVPAQGRPLCDNLGNGQCGDGPHDIFELQNGYTMWLPKRQNRNEIPAAVMAYSDAVLKQVRQENWTKAAQALAAWLLPSLVALLFGYAIAWVRRGFRESSTA